VEVCKQETEMKRSLCETAREKNYAAACRFDLQEFFPGVGTRFFHS